MMGIHNTLVDSKYRRSLLLIKNSHQRTKGNIPFVTGAAAAAATNAVRIMVRCMLSDSFDALNNFLDGQRLVIQM